MAEAFADNCVEGDITKVLHNGETITNNINMDEYFSVNEESAHLILSLELPDLINKYKKKDLSGKDGWQYYVRLGAICLSARQLHSANNILKRTAFQERAGLARDGFNTNDILSKTISEKEMNFLNRNNKKNSIKGVL